MTVEEARELRVCRVCGGPDLPRQVVPGLIDSFVFNFGKEYAHASCIGEPATKVWPGFPSLVVDRVDDEGIHLRPAVNPDEN